MWLTDLFLSLPQLPLLLLVIYLFRDKLKAVFGLEMGIFIMVVVVIGGLRWMPVARLVRAQFLSLREKEFVEAARALGASKRRQVLRHILPNALGPVIVAATIDVAAAIIAESTLSFLGLGFPPDIPTWGRLLFDAKEYLDFAPHYALFPGARHLPHRAVDQLHRRRPPGRARSAAGAVMAEMLSHLARCDGSRRVRRASTIAVLATLGFVRVWRGDDAASATAGRAAAIGSGCLAAMARVRAPGAGFTWPRRAEPVVGRGVSSRGRGTRRPRATARRILRPRDGHDLLRRRLRGSIPTDCRLEAVHPARYEQPPPMSTPAASRRQRRPLLEIQGLKTHFKTDDGLVRAVDGVDISIHRGRDGRHRRRIRLRQDRHGHVGAEADRRCRPARSSRARSSGRAAISCR